MNICNRIFLLVLIPTMSAICFAQPNGGKASTEKDLYTKSLFAGIAEMDKSWGRFDDSYSGVRTDYRHMIVEKNPEITDDLPEKVGDYQVEYLDAPALVAKYKSLGKAFSILELHPIRIEGARLTIEISKSWFSYRKRRMFIGVSDWADVDFDFDCAKQLFVVAQVKLGGI